MLLWLSDAPKYDPTDVSSEKEICDFIDKFISCSSELIEDDLVSVQTHKHSQTCKKGNEDDTCRFGIPYLPMTHTCVLQPLDEKYSESKKKELQKQFNRIKKKLNKRRILQMNHNDFLKFLRLSQKSCIFAVRSSLKKPQIFLKRCPQDIFISSFSLKLVKLMRSNQNLQ